MKHILFLVLIAFLANSCLKENLDTTNLDKIVVFKIDYKTYNFEGGKEFSYFENDNSTTVLPITTLPNIPNSGSTNGRLTVLYTNDTIFDGTMIWQGQGKVNYLTNLDSPTNYYKLDFNVTKPADSCFQICFYDLGAEPIKYDSIWGAISKISLVNDYRLRNSTAKIGLFLYRPSDGFPTPNQNGDWKWYVVMKN